MRGDFTARGMFEMRITLNSGADKTDLRHLVAEAVALAGGNLCSIAHEWDMDGGRACPHGERCSQPVYRCTRCGEFDYGNPGGPAYLECANTCQRGHSDKFVMRKSK